MAWYIESDEREEPTTKNTLPRNTFRFDREIKSFSDKQKLKVFSTTKPAVLQMLKELSRQEAQEKEK